MSWKPCERGLAPRQDYKTRQSMDHLSHGGLRAKEHLRLSRLCHGQRRFCLPQAGWPWELHGGPCIVGRKKGM